jgi:hypothetical protein
MTIHVAVYSDYKDVPRQLAQLVRRAGYEPHIASTLNEADEWIRNNACTYLVSFIPKKNNWFLSCQSVHHYSEHPIGRFDRKADTQVIVKMIPRIIDVHAEQDLIIIKQVERSKMISYIEQQNNQSRLRNADAIAIWDGNNEMLRKMVVPYCE